MNVLYELQRVHRKGIYMTTEKKIETYHRLEKTRLFAGGVSTSTLYSWIRAKRFPAPVRLGPRCVAWRERDLIAWQEQRNQQMK